MRYLISVSYDGSKYYGFQKLNRHKTVQGELEKALTKINKTVVYVKGSGRTDRGVHALKQKCHFDLNIEISPTRLINAINSLIDNGMYVSDCCYVDKDFHARFSVKEKTYKYVINMGEYNPIRNDYIYNYCKKLDVKLMKKASKYLLGKHSYKTFVSGERDNYNSEIYNIKFRKIKDDLIITFVGKSFYRYMVRNLVGALLLVGKNKIEYKEVRNMVDNDSYKVNYMTVPANGLYLIEVKY